MICRLFLTNLDYSGCDSVVRTSDSVTDMLWPLVFYLTINGYYIGGGTTTLLGGVAIPPVDLHHLCLRTWRTPPFTISDVKIVAY